MIHAAAIAIVAALGLTACTGASEDRAEQPQSPDPTGAMDAGRSTNAATQGSDNAALVARIESHIVMPPGAAPLDEYSRRYSRSGYGPGDEMPGKVSGLLLRHTDNPPGAAWQDGPLGRALDGGCGVITLIYDEASDTIEDIRCNGEA